MKAVLHVISDRQRHMTNLESALFQAAAGGADVIQIREKKAPAAETYQLCTTLKNQFQTLAHVPQLFVNDRVDVAIATSANGVHLASKSLPLHAVHKLAKLASWHGMVGVSVHSKDEAIRAAEAGADYVTFGHIFASESHRGEPPRGLLALENVVHAVNIPVIAIGGIEASNVGPVLESGCSGIAVIGAVLLHPQPKLAVELLKEQLNQATATPKHAFLPRQFTQE